MRKLETGEIKTQFICSDFLSSGYSGLGTEELAYIHEFLAELAPMRGLLAKTAVRTSQMQKSELASCHHVAILHGLVRTATMRIPLVRTATGRTSSPPRQMHACTHARTRGDRLVAVRTRHSALASSARWPCGREESVQWSCGIVMWRREASPDGHFLHLRHSDCRFN